MDSAQGKEHLCLADISYCRFSEAHCAIWRSIQIKMTVSETFLIPSQHKYNSKQRGVLCTDWPRVHLAPSLSWKKMTELQSIAFNTLIMNSLWLFLTQLYRFNDRIKTTPHESVHFLLKLSSLWCWAFNLTDDYCSATCTDGCIKCLPLPPLRFQIPGTHHATAPQQE